MDELHVTSPAFSEGGWIPKRHTGFGENLSPELRLTGLCSETASLCVVLDDLDIPFLGEMNHWVMWNVPPTDVLPAGVPSGDHPAWPTGAVQGIGYGKHCYAGPKQPPFIRAAHRYRFTVYALDCLLDLPVTAHKADLVHAAAGHVLQTGTLMGRYQRG